MKSFQVSLDKTLIENRNSQIPMWKKVKYKYRKIYLFSFEKLIEDQTVNFLKIGVTDYYEAWDRILANQAAFKQGLDDWVETSMYEYFDKVSICASAMVAKDIANKIEKDIKKAWGDDEFKLPKMNGMSEIKIYSDQRYAIAKLLIEKHRYVRG
jgi:hypothetical protein